MNQADKRLKTGIVGCGGMTMAPRLDSATVEELPLPRFDFDRNTLYRNFVETVRGEAAQIVTQEHALRVLMLMEAALRSSRTGAVDYFEQ